jgi:hypothetical protein
MPIGFPSENRLHIYGDNKGFIVIEEWTDDDFSDLLGKVKIHVEKFKALAELHKDDLIYEAFFGEKNDKL